MLEELALPACRGFHKEYHSIYPFTALLDLFRFYFLVALEKCFNSQKICT